MDILIIERRKTENILGKKRTRMDVEIPVQLPGRRALCTPICAVCERFLQGSTGALHLSAN